MLTWVPGTSQHQCRSLPALWEKCKQYSPAEHLCVSALALSPTAAHTLKPCALPARPSPLTACLSFGHLPAPGSAMANLCGAAGRTPLRQAPPASAGCHVAPRAHHHPCAGRGSPLATGTATGQSQQACHALTATAAALPTPMETRCYGEGTEGHTSPPRPQLEAREEPGHGSAAPPRRNVAAKSSNRTTGAAVGAGHWAEGGRMGTTG